MVNDGRKVYNHGTDGKGQLIGGCHVGNIVNSDGPVKCKVIYSRGHLQVQFFDPRSGAYNLCFEADQVRLPRSGYIGFTASTGASSAEHDLLSVTTATFSGHQNEHNHSKAMRVIESKSARGGFVLIMGVSGTIFYLCYRYIMLPMLIKMGHGKRDPVSSRMNKMYGTL